MKFLPHVSEFGSSFLEELPIFFEIFSVSGENEIQGEFIYSG